MNILQEAFHQLNEYWLDNKILAALRLSSLDVEEVSNLISKHPEIKWKRNYFAKQTKRDNDTRALLIADSKSDLNNFLSELNLELDKQYLPLPNDANKNKYYFYNCVPIKKVKNPGGTIEDGIKGNVTINSENYNPSTDSLQWMADNWLNIYGSVNKDDKKLITQFEKYLHFTPKTAEQWGLSAYITFKKESLNTIPLELKDKIEPGKSTPTIGSISLIADLINNHEDLGFHGGINQNNK